MRGGHGDDYYYQLVSYVRRFKGARPAPVAKPKAIDIDGEFGDWSGVEPEFKDTIADAVDREFRGWDSKVIYRNKSGRNDIVAAKASWDRDRIYFYVRTREPLSPWVGTNWMNLFIDIDRDATTGRLGYDLAVNLQTVGAINAALKLKGNEMEMSIPWSAAGRNAPASFDFKWADNCFESGDWSDFTLNGDAAPNDRFNYRFTIE